MDLFLEILLHIILEPVVEILVGPAADGAEEYLKRSRLPKWLRIVFVVLITVCLIGMLLCIILGTILLIIAETEEEKPIYLCVLLSGLAMLAVYVTIVVIRLNMKKRRKRAVKKANCENTRPDRTALRRKVHVIVDRPIGSVHPEHSDIVYGVNYGYVPDAMSGDGEAQDAYVLGIDTPIEEADGVVIAVIHRLDDAEDKWVVAPSGCAFTDEEIIEKTEFQEKFFKTELIR